MSKKVKSLVERDIRSRLSGVDGVAVVSPRGLDGNKNNKLRGKLRAKGLRMTVVKNTLARRAVAGTKIDGFDKLLDGPSAVIYGPGVAVPSIARFLVDEKMENEALELRGVFFDGEVYPGEQGVITASKLPTREEAIANILAAVLGPGRKLAAALKGPGGTVGAVLKTIEDKAKAKEGAPA